MNDNSQNGTVIGDTVIGDTVIGDTVTYFTREPRIRQCVVCERFLAIPYNYIGAGYHLHGWETSDGKLHYGFHCGECFDKMHNIEAFKLKRPSIQLGENHETL